MAKRSKADREHAEKMEKMRLNAELINSGLKVLTTLIYMAGFGVIMCFAYLMIKELAGQVTQANILSDIRFGWAVSLSAGGAGLLYGRKERKLRKRTVSILQERIRFLEQQLDAKRTTSRLTDMGNTNPKDL